MTSVFKKKNLLALRIVLFVALLLLAGVVAFAEASDSEMLPGFDAPDSYFIFVQKEVKGLEKDQLTDLSFKIINSGHDNPVDLSGAYDIDAADMKSEWKGIGKLKDDPQDITITEQEDKIKLEGYIVNTRYEWASYDTWATEDEVKNKDQDAFPAKISSDKVEWKPYKPDEKLHIVKKPTADKNHNDEYHYYMYYVRVINEYIPKDRLGSLTIIKELAGNYPEDAIKKEYTVTIESLNDPDFRREEIITSEKEVTIEDLPAGEYKITENGYEIEGFHCTPDYKQVVEIKGKETTTATITNTYEQKGSLVIKKALAGNYPSEANSHKYEFLIEGENGTVVEDIFVTGAGESQKIELPPGTYKIIEKEFQLSDYNCTIEGNGSTVIITAGENKEVTITNKYEKTDPKDCRVNIVKKVEGIKDEATLEDLKNKLFEFKITGPNYEDVVEVRGINGLGMREGLTAGKYTVTEDTEHLPEIDGYKFEKVKIEPETFDFTEGDTKEITFTVTNTYRKIENKGQFKIEKEVEGIKDETLLQGKSFPCIVTGPNGYKEEIQLEVGKEKLLQDLKPGTYTITEDKENLPTINEYEFESVTISPSEIEVAEDGSVRNALVVVKNTYKETNEPPAPNEKGEIIISKSVKGLENYSGPSKEFKFIVEGPKGKDPKSYSVTVSAGKFGSSNSGTVKELPYGEYTIREDTSSAEIYGFTFIGVDKKEATVKLEGEKATVKFTNTYKPDQPSSSGGGGDSDPDPDPSSSTPSSSEPSSSSSEPSSSSSEPSSSNSEPGSSQPPRPIPWDKLPDPNDPESPELVTIIDGDTPRTFMKVEDPLVGMTYVEIFDELPPLTGDNSHNTLWALICLPALFAAWRFGRNPAKLSKK
ncbi:MAG: hypothetical protein HFG20_01780 [Anaerotruncus sp.]|nr:hypothetical protein [Anaerotruncus sp.]